MGRIVYVNGQYVDESDAKVSIFDRGFLFADAVYEVTAVINGRLLESEGHLARLKRSCNELQLKMPVSQDQLLEIHRQLIEKNQLREGGIYMQLTRGRDKDRDFSFPPADTPATLVLFTQAKNLLDCPIAKKGIKVVSVPDLRWRRRDIKTVQLLCASLAKEYAHTQGADDAFLVEDGYVTEGSASNAFIIQHDNTIVTRPLSNDILHGITRKAIIQLIEQDRSFKLEERLFTIEEAKAAKEAFVSAATAFIWPVVSIDGHMLGDGKPGPIASRLRALYLDAAKKAVGLA
ncbi:D-amino-acid transaminase [Saezia sanguinis]|uniref:D-amino-acid transaminase n=1 Tax=Saezia sanguinis TaxID=1965230 RepID=UPI0030321AA5